MSIMLDEDAAARPPTDDRGPAAPRGSSRGSLVWRRLRRNKLAVLGAVIIALLFVAAFTYGWYWPWTYTQSDPTSFLSPPGPDHLFGTDNAGFDMYAQTMRGLQKSLIIGLLVAVLSTAMSAVVGSIAGYFRGWADWLVSAVVDLLLTLPAFLILAVLSPAFRGQTWLLFVLLIAAFNWMITARIVRGMTLTLKEQEFVRAARLMGVPSWRVITRHIFPQMSSLLIVDATVNVGGAILTETSLSYFGFGIQPPDISLGTLIADNTASALTFPWLFFIPAGFLVVTVLAVNLVGDGLRDAFDPNSTRGVRRAERRELRAERRAARAEGRAA
ncbi:MAG TPA: ABC transporter permease [Pseudonocardiaceae bacterium]|jgi:peptide/nickel transport system permease protein|nr:ABC transporter permease [Pseudonocardiaceae bacterium]